MLDLTVLCGIDREDPALLASSLLLREDRAATIWIDPSTAFLGRLSAVLSDGDGWRESLEVDLLCDCVGCGYLQAVQVCIARLVELDRYDLAALQLAPSVEPDGAMEALCASLDDETARLDSVVTVLTAGQWIDDLAGGQCLGERGVGVHAEDDRPVSELIASQIAAADGLLVKGSGATDDELAALAALAPSVRPIVTTDLLDVPAAALTRTRRHLPRCLSAYHRDGLLDWSAQLPPRSGGVRLVRWRSQRPFHAERLHDALEALADQVLRSSGRIVIASTSDRWTRWESSGESLSLGDLGPRGTEPLESRLTLLGFELDADRISGLLELSVLTDRELAAGPAGWHRFDDPFAVETNDEERR